MIRILLINQTKIPHYRVPVYNYLSEYLKKYGFDFIVVSEGLQTSNPHVVEFNFREIKLSTLNLSRFITKNEIVVIISWVDMKHLYLFPVYFIAKGIMGKKMIYWGQGRDLLDQDSHIKNLAYAIEQSLCDAIILYAEHLKKYIPKRFHGKVFIANNTLHINYPGLLPEKKSLVLTEYGIHTEKNIICMGRMQKRKRIEHLVKAFSLMKRSDIGLILVGPDQEDVLKNISGENIYKLGSIYGDQKYNLLSVADVYCLPGAFGLSIIDAFYCGLPFVTEDGDESAEIMYLKDGVNGFIVPKGDTQALAQKLLLLLDNENLRQKFSAAAMKEVRENANMDKFCAGFRDALFYVTGNQS